MAGQLTIDALKASSGVLATQNGMTGIAKAWVNYNGVAGTIRSSFNVGSVTKNTTGDYTINFTTAMPDANYAITTSAGKGAAGSEPRYAGPSGANPTTSACRITVKYNDTLTSTLQDVEYVSVAILSL